MAKHHKKPVFQEADSAPKVEISPPFQPSEPLSEDFEDIIGGETEENGSEGLPEAEIPAPEPEIEPPSPEIKEPDFEHQVQHEVELQGNVWRPVTPEQQTGKTYLVASHIAEDGVRAFWKKTRMLSQARWVTKGKWVDSVTGAAVAPEPVFYREVF